MLSSTTTFCPYGESKRNITNMVINSTLIFCLIPELKEALVGLKVREILVSADHKELLFCLRDKNKETSLFFCTHPLDCRIEFWGKEETEKHKTNYQKTNLFSFAEGGYVQKIEQLDFDRIIKISCEKESQFGTGEPFDLIFELAGRNANLVLVKKDGMIVDCLRKIDVTQNRFRQILPGIKYVPPPTPTKKNPFSTSKEESTRLIRTDDQSISEWLSSHFTGVDRLLVQKIIIESGLDLGKKISRITEEEIALLWKTFSQTFEKISKHNFSFQIINDRNGDPKAISCVDLPFIPEDQKIHYPSLNSAIKGFFSGKLEREKRKREVHKLSSVVHQTLEKLKKREKKIEEDFKQAERFEEYKRFGELLMMNKESIKRGETSVRLTDVFDPAHPMMEIPLDSRLGAIKNSQAYFKKYKKAKDALSIIKKRKSETEDQIAYLEEIFTQLLMPAEEIDLKEQRQDLIRLGLLRPTKTRTKEKKKKEFSPRRFLTKSGREIFVGRNNKENDYLTFKFAQPDDLWFHAQDVSGSHVLLKRKNKKTDPSFSDIKEAASVAVYFSKAKKEKRAVVIYTQAKYVRKPKRGKPGLALVGKEKSVLVEPGLPAGSSGPGEGPAPDLS
jgi:predicted ribosome quality control (RQC) complex YloA/Tae2 family protein